MSQRPHARPGPPPAATSHLSPWAIAGTTTSGLAALIDVAEKEGWARSALVLSIALAVGGLAFGTTKLLGVVRRRLRADAAGRRMVTFAAALAGRSRGHLRVEWLAHLAGSPEDGRVLTAWQRRRHAAGFLLSALRMRLRDLARPLWRPVDWVLSTVDRTNTAITTVVGALVLYICVTDGLHVLITERLEACGAVGVGLYALSRWLRRVRGIELTPRQQL